MLHMIQMPTIGLVAVGLWLMVGGIDRRDGASAMAMAWIARAATFVFLVYFTALDAIGGIGLGRTILVTEGLRRKASSRHRTSRASSCCSTRHGSIP